MKSEFFQMKVNNKLLLPAILVFVIASAAVYWIVILSNNDPEIITDNIQGNKKPVAAPPPVIKTYPERDSFKPLVSLKKEDTKKEEENKEDFDPNKLLQEMLNAANNQGQASPTINTISLKGIVTSNNKTSALLHIGDKVHTVSVGDTIPGYGTVTSISNTQLVIFNGANKLILTVGG